MIQTIKRISKRTLSIVLTLMMIVSTMMVGMVAVDAAIAVHGYIYFVKPASWTSSKVLFMVGKNNWSTGYGMSKVANTENLYYYNLDSSLWNDATQYAFFNTSSVWDGEGNSIGNRAPYSDHYTATSTSALSSGSYYVITPASGDNNAALTVSKQGTAYSSLNKKQDVVVQTSTDGSTYSAATTSPADISISGYAFSSTSNCSDTKSDSISQNASDNSLTATVGYLSKTTLTVSSTISGYEFVGWYSGNTLLEDGTTYTYYPKSANTVYARFDLSGYAIECETSAYGKLESSTGYATTGAKVAFTATANMGYELDTLTIAGNTITSGITTNGNVSTYEYTMGSSAVTASATFKKSTYTVGTEAATGGSITIDKSTAQYEDKVTITATPDSDNDYILSGVSVVDADGNAVNVTGSGNIREFSMPASNVTITPTFTKNVYKLGVTCNEDGGTVVTYVNGTESTDFSYGDTVKIVPTANAGYELSKITVGDNDVNLTDGYYEFTVTSKSAIAVTAEFIAKTYNVTYSTVDGVSTTPANVTAQYKSTVTISDYVIEDGYTLRSYTVEDKSGNEIDVTQTGSVYTFTMPASDVTITPIIATVATVTVSSNNAAMGTASASEESVLQGDNVTITATKIGNNRFKSWDIRGSYSIVSGGLNTAEIVITVKGDITATATFEAVPSYTVTATANPATVGSVTPASPTTVLEGGTIELKATLIDTDYKFTGWTITGDYTTSGSTSNATLTITVNGNITATANFVEDQGDKVSNHYLFHNTSDSGFAGSGTNYVDGVQFYKKSGAQVYTVSFTPSDLDKTTFPETNYVGISSSNSVNDIFNRSSGGFTVSTNTPDYVTLKGNTGTTGVQQWGGFYFVAFDLTNTSSIYKVTVQLDKTNKVYTVNAYSNIPTGSIKVYAKNGSTVNGGTHKYGETTITSGHITSVNPTDAGNYNIYYVEPEGGTITIQTQIHSSYVTARYYVGAYVVNGETVEVSDMGKGKFVATYNVPANSDGIEITPVYYNHNIDDAGDYITFYVTAPDSVKTLWGNTIACYSYYYGASNSSTGHGDGSYPGQPMLKTATGKYYTKVAKYYYNSSGVKVVKSTSNGVNTYYPVSGITLNNFSYDSDADGTEAHRDFLTDAQKKNFQTYDYDDFKYIANLNYDTVEFEMQYKLGDPSNQSALLSNATNSPAKTGTQITISTYENRNGFLEFTDYDKNPTDILGNEVTDKTLSKIYIVSTGNQNYSAVGQWATTWYVFKDLGNGKAQYITKGLPSDFIPRPEGTSNTSAYNAMNVADYLNHPTYICYESKMGATAGTNAVAGRDATGIDGRWYYKDSTRSQVTVDTQVWYSDDNGSSWTNDETRTKGTATVNGETSFTSPVSNVTVQLNAIGGTGYVFYEWGKLINGEYVSLTSIPNDTALIDTNYTFVAKFVKLNATDFVISHEQYTGDGAKKGKGFYSVSADLYEADGTVTSLSTSANETSIRFTTLSSNDDKIVITLTTTMSGLNKFLEWYEYTNGMYQIIGPTADEIAQNGNPYDSNDPVSYTFEVDVADLFSGANNLLVQKLSFYSDISPVTANATFYYHYYDRFYTEKVYVKNVKLSEDYIIAHPDYSIANEDGYELVYDNAPYIDDVYKDAKWDVTGQNVTVSGTTATIWAQHTVKDYSVEFTDGEYGSVFGIVGLNEYASYDADEDKIVGGLTEDNTVFYRANEKSGDAYFAYWSVKEDGNEVAKCFSIEFNLKITGNFEITPVYGEKETIISITDATYTREQSTNTDGSVVYDYLYADFGLAFMEPSGVLLNGDLGAGYKTGLIVEFDKNIKVSKDDEENAKLADSDKITFESENATILTSGDIKTFIDSGSSSKVYDPENDGVVNRALYNFEIDNSLYNNKNRLNYYVKFKNTSAYRHYVFRAYYYVITPDGEYHLTAPVYFYLYDIGNSVVS